MKRSTTISMLLSCALFPLLALPSEKTAPSPAAIHQTLEQLWSSRRFEELTAYVGDLERSWDGYVPVQLARAIYSYKYGAQVEEAIDRLKILRSRLQTNIAASSPVFMELLDSRIRRYEDSKKFYLEQGIAREKRLADRNPLKTTEFKHSKHWGEEMLFFNAPEVFLTESGVRSAMKVYEATAVQSLDKVSLKVLQNDVGDEKKPMIERKAFAQELVRRRIAQGGVSNLLHSLRSGDIAYTYQDTIQALVRSGSAAIPGLIGYVNDPRWYVSEQKMAIWALVRIGAADSEVIQALQSVVARTDRADLAKYAGDALHYLQSTNR
jgi:hypothetical protein